jgi:hypothetical protein
VSRLRAGKGSQFLTTAMSNIRQEFANARRWEAGTKLESIALPDTSTAPRAKQAGVILSTFLLYLRFKAETQKAGCDSSSSVKSEFGL